MKPRVAHHLHWINKLKQGARAFNEAQERLPYGEWINLDGADLSEIDIRGCCLKRVSLFNARFRDDDQIYSARLSDPLMDDVPLYKCPPPPKPTNRVVNIVDYRRGVDGHSSSDVLKTHKENARFGRA